MTHHHSAGAKLFYISPVISEETIIAKSYALLDNSEGLWRPGEVVNALIATQKICLPILISKEAILSDDEISYVFIKKDNGF